VADQDPASDQNTAPVLGRRRVSQERFDAIVIGAGFSGLYMLTGSVSWVCTPEVLEKAENVGGTWLFNRYPGPDATSRASSTPTASPRRSSQEWVWTETMPAQPEIEAYLNFVADKLDLRRDISFGTTWSR